MLARASLTASLNWPGGVFWPWCRGSDADEGAQVGAGELAELPGLLVQVADRVSEGLPLVADVPVGGGDVVMLAACSPVVLAVLALHVPQLALGLPDLLKDVLYVLLEGLFQSAELFF